MEKFIEFGIVPKVLVASLCSVLLGSYLYLAFYPIFTDSNQFLIFLGASFTLAISSFLTWFIYQSIVIGRFLFILFRKLPVVKTRHLSRFIFFN